MVSIQLKLFVPWQQLIRMIKTLLNEYGRLNCDNLPRTNKIEVVASAVKDATQTGWILNWLLQYRIW